MVMAYPRATSTVATRNDDEPIDDCDRHGGPWGSDETCADCTDESGEPRSRANSFTRTLALAVQAPDSESANEIAAQILDSIHESDALPDGVTAITAITDTKEQPRASS